MGRTKIFIISLVYLLLLLILGLVFCLKPELLSFIVPKSFGSVPLAVPWFGALGAVLISLTGVFDHKRDWDNDLWPWHLSRPLIGIAVGVVSVLILQAGVLSVGAGKATSNLLYYLVAFLVGYREETFRELIKRLVDVILSPGGGSGGAPPSIQAVNPAQAAHDHPTQIVITGSGFTGAQSVKFGNAAGQQLTVNSDGQLTVTTPTVAAGGNVPLTVTTKKGSATHEFTFT
jgi:hypothetical protein